MKSFFSVLSIIFFIVSCSEKSEIKFNYHTNENIDREIITTNKILKATENKIMYDSTESGIWKRVESIKYYDNHGVCTTKITPRYNIEFKDNYIPIQTYDYLGFSDTTKYEYDKNYRQINVNEILFDKSGRRFLRTTERKFDEFGNQIKECSELENSDIKCICSEYLYDNKKKILSRIDSADFNIGNKMPISLVYEYDNKNNLVSDGEWKYKMDENGKLVERIPLKDNYVGIIIIYDKNGRISQETTTRFNSQTQAIDISKETIFFKYDTNNLLVEKKCVRDGKIKYLLKYDYEK